MLVRHTTIRMTGSPISTCYRTLEASEKAEQARAGTTSPYPGQSFSGQRGERAMSWVSSGRLRMLEKETVVAMWTVEVRHITMLYGRMS